VLRRTESDPRELARLPGTAREVAAIAGLAGDGVVLRATGLQATRAAFLQMPADRIDVLHVATHATIDPDIPELAGLVLSRLDATGRSLPGNVRAHDILGLRVAPALVVLSACDAAAEPAGAAEGRMNLVRAFLASGSRHVVASLWEASDAATVELMTRFYEGLLQQRLDPGAALVRAQRALAASERWRAPFYWAGFVITQAAP
jgi:CHAT domain-containing protein